jgi:hypothetical protein
LPGQKNKALPGIIFPKATTWAAASFVVGILVLSEAINRILQSYFQRSIVRRLKYEFGEEQQAGKWRLDVFSTPNRYDMYNSGIINSRERPTIRPFYE